MMDKVSRIYINRICHNGSANIGVLASVADLYSHHNNAEEDIVTLLLVALTFGI